MENDILHLFDDRRHSYYLLFSEMCLTISSLLAPLRFAINNFSYKWTDGRPQSMVIASVLFSTSTWVFLYADQIDCFKSIFQRNKLIEESLKTTSVDNNAIAKWNSVVEAQLRLEESFYIRCTCIFSYSVMFQELEIT